MGTITVMAKTGIGVRPENRCHATAAKTGKRCRAAKVTLKTVDGDVVRYRFCLGHLLAKAGPRKIEIRHGIKIGGKQPGAGRPAVPTASEVLRHKIEKEYGLDTIFRPYFDAVTGAVLHTAYQGEVVVSNEPDVGARIEAAERLLDRAYGRPKQTTELSGPEGGPIAVEVPTGEERAAQVAALLGGALGAQQAPTTTNGTNGRNGHVE